MNFCCRLLLLAGLASAGLASLISDGHDYTETLHLKPLPGGSFLYAGFNFTSSISGSDYDSQHFGYFPRALGQILQYTHTAELHLRFALGRWDEDEWGRRPRGGRREGGTGVELWAWLEGDTQAHAEERWTELVNSLSGLFCASLNFIDRTKTSQPMFSFEPEGTILPTKASLHLMHGMLPHEVICTENLTPFLKLLPCKGKAGISSLLDGHKVFDANWQTMAIDVRPIRRDEGDHRLEIEQTVDLVLDVERSMRPRHSPIPRPRPIEEIKCDENKAYNAEDTCYPMKLDASSLRWSLSGIFGRPIAGSCPIGHRSTSEDVILDNFDPGIAHSDGDRSGPGTVFTGTSRTVYQLRAMEDFDLVIPATMTKTAVTASDKPVLRASRQITGYGQERGSMHTIIHNPHAHEIQLVYLESLPWFLRPYLHTLRSEGATLESMYCVPAVDRQRGTALEVLLTVPANSSLNLSYDFEKAILRYTEYPPDANRGFDIAPAVIRILPFSEGDDSQGLYTRTTSLLLPLPTPDFSMPYNVIILSSTVIALGFGSIFNLLIRHFGLQSEAPESKLGAILRRITTTIQSKIRNRSPQMRAARNT